MEGDWFFAEYSLLIYLKPAELREVLLISWKGLDQQDLALSGCDINEKYTHENPYEGCLQKSKRDLFFYYYYY